MPKQLTSRMDPKRFFANLKAGDVFTYSEGLDYESVAKLAAASGVRVGYCRPNSIPYRQYGAFTCIVIDTPINRGILGIVESVDRSLRLYVIRGLNVLYQHEELQGRDDATQHYIFKALEAANSALCELRNAMDELGIELEKEKPQE